MRISILFLSCLFLSLTSIAQNKEAVENFNAAVKLYKAKDYDQAIESFSKALDNDDQFVKENLHKWLT